jgi:hypothetical protein
MVQSGVSLKVSALETQQDDGGVWDGRRFPSPRTTNDGMIDVQLDVKYKVYSGVSRTIKDSRVLGAF